LYDDYQGSNGSKTYVSAGTFEYLEQLNL